MEDKDTIGTLAIELEEIVQGYLGKRRKHVLEVKDDAEFSLQSGVSRIIKEFYEEFGDDHNLMSDQSPSHEIRYVS